MRVINPLRVLQKSISVKSTSPDNRGWAKIKEAAKYAGVSVRTFRDWLKDGLRHSRLSTGTILVAYAAIDEYLERFEVKNNQVDEFVNQVVKEFRY
jgi:excisionase family DNA binding protein